MPLPRDLATLADLVADSTAFHPQSRAVLASLPEAAPVLAAIERAIPGTDPAAVAMLAIRTLKVARNETAALETNAALVATVPRYCETNVRQTAFVVREMLASARTSVLAVGYHFSDHQVIDGLSEAAGRGAEVTVVCDRGQGSASNIMRRWPSHLMPPAIYQDREHGQLTKASLHTKVLLIDRADLLVTSANFTYLGHAENIEFGVRLNGRPAADAWRFFAQLFRSGLLERMTVATVG
ncbi:MAG: phospholipase D-like domain-containing protein [Myxococcota bacterium]